MNKVIGGAPTPWMPIVPAPPPREPDPPKLVPLTVPKPEVVRPVWPRELKFELTLPKVVRIPALESQAPETNEDAAAAEVGRKIAEWENFIRYDPNDWRAERTFRAIVTAASAQEDYERNLEYADLVDIESAQYDDRTGELILIGPRLRELNRGYLPPLLVADDFVMALRVLDAVGERELGVSIGTYDGQIASQAEMQQAAQEGRVPITYIPRMTASRHIGFVLFEADRWLKNLALGIDTHSLKPLTVPVTGYRSQVNRARDGLRNRAEENETGWRPYGLNWFLPDEPQVVADGFSMKFVSYHMTVKYKAMVDDPAIAEFAEHLTNNFESYCRQYPVFQELVRLHKLIQVAKWYRACEFPDDQLDDYTPLRIPTLEWTRRIESSTGRVSVPGGYVECRLAGGVDFSPGNVYVPPAAVRAPVLQPGAPALAQPFHVPETIAPRRYGTYVGPAPVPAFIAPIVQARPAPTAYSWTVRVDGRMLKAIAIPTTRKAMTPRS